MKEHLVRLTSALLVMFAAIILYNNLQLTHIVSDEIEESLVRATDWVMANERTIKEEHNIILWWMLEQANARVEDERVSNLLDQYRRNNYQRYAYSPWRYLYDGGRSTVDALKIITSGMSDYNVHFIFGFSCDNELGEMEIVQAQNQTDFCLKHHPISPACVTHQMMGFRFMQRAGCSAQNTVEEKIDVLARKIQRQLFYDFRVVDVYIQRILMLLESNNAERINQRWLQRFLDAQLDDGGWGDFQPVFPVGGGRYLGFTKKSIGVRTPRSDLHATAQAIWILALLKDSENSALFE